MWYSLLHRKIPYIGQFYDEFVDNRTIIINHLSGCKTCRRLMLDVFPGGSTSVFKNMSDDELRATIDNMRDTAIAKSQIKKKTP